MVECPKDPVLAAGTWNLWKTGKVGVLFSCPRCGAASVIHGEISSGGETSESFQCETKGCLFRDRLRLLGWEPEVS